MEGSNSSSTLYPSPSIPSVISFTRSSKLIQSYGGRGQVSDVRKNAQGGRGGGRLGDSGGLHLQARGGRNSDRHGVDRGGDHSKLRHLQSSADEGFTPPSESPENGTGPSSVQQIRIPGKANAEPNPEPSTSDKAMACCPACAPCQASSESYRPPRGLG